jgi:hypothetical protein
MLIASRRRLFLASAVALGLGVPLRAARACEFFTGRLRVTHPWTRATAPGATTAVLCMGLDEVQEVDRLIGVRTPVATGVEMGGAQAGRPLDLVLEPGQRLDLTEEGLHLQLTGLTGPLHAGRQYRLELLFEHAGPVATAMSVDFDVAPSPKSFTTRRFL